MASSTHFVKAEVPGFVIAVYRGPLGEGARHPPAVGEGEGDAVWGRFSRLGHPMILQPDRTVDDMEHVYFGSHRESSPWQKDTGNEAWGKEKGRELLASGTLPAPLPPPLLLGPWESLWLQ